jgi:probable selenium-dependent hydroxylase accessory protein YqeC
MDLCEALAIGTGDVVAIVGGGGKTTVLYRLGAELAGRGERVLLCGTTRFTPPEGGDPPNLTLVTDLDDLMRSVETESRPLTVAAGWGSKGRLLPLEPAGLDALHRRHPEIIVVIEADGSAMRPFKAPGEREPVVPTSATVVVTVAGMDVVGRPLDERAVHRPERVSAISGAAGGTPVTPALIATVLGHPDGGRKAVPPAARWAVVLNKADTAERRTAAETVAALLAGTAERVVIANARRVPPVVEVRTRALPRRS